MRIREVDEQQADVLKLAGLAEFLIGRSNDTGASAQISVDAFVNMARNLGISVDAARLQNLSQQPPLNNVINKVTDDTIYFVGSEPPDQDMSVDKARQTVDTMAKRAGKKTFDKL
jgi:hypothetical protein